MPASAVGARFKPGPRRAMGTLNRSLSTSALRQLDQSDDESVVSESPSASVCSATTPDAESEIYQEIANSTSAAAPSEHDEEDQVSAHTVTTTSSCTDKESGSCTSGLMVAIRNFDRSKNLRAPRSVVDTSVAKSTLVGPFSTDVENLAATKRDLIAELKESKGLAGIKRMKESSKSKVGLDQIVASMMPVFKADDFLAKVAENEPEAPHWRRQMLAKKAAERARKECEERMRNELEKRRQSQVPVWKRQMLAKKAAERNKKEGYPDRYTREQEERRNSEMPTWKLQLERIKLTASTGNVNEIGK